MHRPCPLSAISPAAVCVLAAVRDDTAPATHTCSAVLGPTECQSMPVTVTSDPAGLGPAGTSGSSAASAVFPTTIHSMHYHTITPATHQHFDHNA